MSDYLFPEPPERVLSTLETDGSRRWIHPRLSKGRFWKARMFLGYFLIALFVALPFIKINGRPAMLLDLARREFSLFGMVFLPTDTLLLAVFMLMFLLSIFALTALLGRVWCGWGCPQTVYMEFLFRPLERLCTGKTGVGGKPQNVAPWRYALYYVISFIACAFLANVFLAYFVGVDQLKIWVTQSPFEHPAGFLIVAAVTLLMAFDFLYFREQTCIIACPYGRLQSVLLDRKSLIISYDAKRGEPRGKLVKDAPKTTGDCVDCHMCVQVCPTGIDIRQGLQVECIACTQCIDACDAVMDKLKLPRGLVRYSSQAALAGEPSRILRPRVLIYGTLVFGLFTLLATLIATQAPADVTLLRGVGSPFRLTADDQVENVVMVKIVNRTKAAQQYTISILDEPRVQIKTTDTTIRLEPGQTLIEPIHLIVPRELFKLGSLKVKIRTTTGDGANIDKTMKLLGPL